MSPKSILMGLLRVAGLGILIFVGTEVLLRVLQPRALQYFRNVKLLHVYHPEYLVGLAPEVDLFIRHYQGTWQGRFTTNSFGHRGSPEPDHNRPQLVCLGDSLVMGFGVSDGETFCAQLQGLSLGETRYQALNLGVDAFGTLGAARRLGEALRQQREGKQGKTGGKLNLKKALFFISPNDFEMGTDMRALGHLPDDEKDALREKNPTFKTWFRVQFELTRVSYLLNALKLAYAQLRIKYAGAKAGTRDELVAMGLLLPTCAADERAVRQSPLNYFTNAFYRRWQNTQSRCVPKGMSSEKPKAARAGADCGASPEQCRARRKAFMDIRNRPDYEVSLPPAERVQRFCRPARGCMARAPADDELRPLPEFTRKAYDKMIRMSRDNGVEFSGVMLPIQIETLQCAARGKHSALFNYSLRVRKYLKSRGVRVLDLRPYVREMCGDEFRIEKGPLRGRIRPSEISDYIIPGDGHFTVQGNRWAAEALRRALKRVGPAK